MVVQHLKVSWHILICLYNSSNPRHMGKSFKSVITVFRGYFKHEDSVHMNSAKNLTHQHLPRHGYGDWKTVCVQPVCIQLHPLDVLLAMALFVPKFGLVLFSGCSCSFHPGEICTGSNKNMSNILKFNCLRTRNTWLNLVEENWGVEMEMQYTKKSHYFVKAYNMM